MDDKAPSSSNEATARIAVRLAGPGGEDAVGWLAAETCAAGSTGSELRQEGDDAVLLIYAPASRADAVRAAVVTAQPGGSVSAIEAVPEIDWSQGWKRGLSAVEISPRLLVRPSFVAAAPQPGQRELIVDPGQAFGTGTHESTRGVLGWIDALRGELAPGCRVLDVGTGTGLLALASAVLLDARCVAFDTDPRATEAARDNARANDLGDSVELFTGPLEAIAGARFELVVANLLKNEMLPLLAGMAARTLPGGRMVLAGLLAREVSEILPVAEAAGLELAEERHAEDANGDRWAALLMRRPRDPANRREAIRATA